MEREYLVGAQTRMLANLCRREIDNAMTSRKLEQFTGMQGRVIGYLYKNKSTDIFQRDVEEEFSIRRSTATAMLQTMEKHGLIVRKASLKDARMKKLVLTDKAMKRFEIFNEEISKLENRMTENISQDELDCFFSTIQKIKSNLGE